MKKYLLGFLAIVLLLPLSVSARGSNPNGILERIDQPDKPLDPDKYNDFDVTPWLSGFLNQEDVRQSVWRGKKYDGYTVEYSSEATFYSVADLQGRVDSLERQVATQSQQISILLAQVNQNPVGGYPDQPQVVQQQSDLTPRIEQLEKRVGYLEMALDYFNNWMVKIGKVLKIK